jgi:hypothetical protein
LYSITVQQPNKKAPPNVAAIKGLTNIFEHVNFVSMEKTPFSDDPSTPNVENGHHITNQTPNAASGHGDSFAGKESMSSVEIAELAESLTSDVMKAIRVMEESWVKLGQPKF